MSSIDYQTFTKKYKIVRNLGEGTLGVVREIMDKQTQIRYALKIQRFKSLSEIGKAFNQIEVIRSVNHHNAITIYHYYTKTHTQYLKNNFQKWHEIGIIMELGLCDLQQEISQRAKNSEYYTENQIDEALNNLLSCLVKMQARGYIHRDIKPTNILKVIDSKGICYKLCDFGFAVKVSEISDIMIAGTYHYASPKIISKFENPKVKIKGNTFKDDVFSLGVTFLDMLNLQHNEKVEVALDLAKGRYKSSLISFIERMLEKDEFLRPDFVEIYQKLDLLNSQLNCSSDDLRVDKSLDKKENKRKEDREKQSKEKLIKNKINPLRTKRRTDKQGDNKIQTMKLATKKGPENFKTHMLQWINNSLNPQQLDIIKTQYCQTLTTTQPQQIHNPIQIDFMSQIRDSNIIIFNEKEIFYVVLNYKIMFMYKNIFFETKRAFNKIYNVFYVVDKQRLMICEVGNIMKFIKVQEILYQMQVIFQRNQQECKLKSDNHQLLPTVMSRIVHKLPICLEKVTKLSQHSNIEQIVMCVSCDPNTERLMFGWDNGYLSYGINKSIKLQADAIFRILFSSDCLYTVNFEGKIRKFCIKAASNSKQMVGFKYVCSYTPMDSIIAIEFMETPTKKLIFVTQKGFLGSVNSELGTPELQRVSNSLLIDAQIAISGNLFRVYGINIKNQSVTVSSADNIPHTKPIILSQDKRNTFNKILITKGSCSTSAQLVSKKGKLINYVFQ